MATLREAKRAKDHASVLREVVGIYHRLIVERIADQPQAVRVIVRAREQDVNHRTQHALTGAEWTRAVTNACALVTAVVQVCALVRQEVVDYLLFLGKTIQQFIIQAIKAPVAHD